MRMTRSFSSNVSPYSLEQLLCGAPHPDDPGVEDVAALEKLPCPHTGTGEETPVGVSQPRRLIVLNLLNDQLVHPAKVVGRRRDPVDDEGEATVDPLLRIEPGPAVYG